LHSQCMHCYIEIGAFLLCTSCTLCFAGGKLVLGASLAICLLNGMICAVVACSLSGLQNKPA